MCQTECVVGLPNSITSWRYFYQHESSQHVIPDHKSLLHGTEDFIVKLFHTKNVVNVVQRSAFPFTYQKNCLSWNDYAHTVWRLIARRGINIVLITFHCLERKIEGFINSREDNNDEERRSKSRSKEIDNHSFAIRLFHIENYTLSLLLFSVAFHEPIYYIFNQQNV